VSSPDIYWRCKQGVIETIKALDLSSASDVLAVGERVYDVVMMADRADVKYPAVFVSSDGGIERFDAAKSTNAYRVWEYPVAVAIRDRETTKAVQKSKTYHTWRQAIWDEFDVRQPAKVMEFVPECQWCKVEPLTVFDPTQPQYQDILSSLLIWVCCARPRLARKAGG
jgi:hypothetical protein